MTERITITIDAPVTENQAMNIATDITTKYCYAWTDISGFEYNPENARLSDAVLVVHIIAPNNEWEFFFMDSFVVKKH